VPPTGKNREKETNNRIDIETPTLSPLFPNSTMIIRESHAEPTISYSNNARAGMIFNRNPYHANLYGNR
jgi:hypothetical protein